MTRSERAHPLPDLEVDRQRLAKVPDTPQTRAPSYRLAFDDPDFLVRDELRPIRLQLELLKPEMAMAEYGIVSTVVLFGGARIPDPEHKETARTKTLADLSRYYSEAREFARLITVQSRQGDCLCDVIVTGGGPGIMEAGNRGAVDAGGVSIGLNIVLPHEQSPNRYVTPDLCFNFHYFAIRKMHFLMRASALAFFPGGFGTMDELFESLTLIQSGRMKRIPIVMFGKEFWQSVINWDALVQAGTISPQDVELFRFVETADEAMEVIANFQV